VKFFAYKSELSNFFLAFVHLDLFSAACPWAARSLDYYAFFSYVSWLESVLVVSEPLARVPEMDLDDRPEVST
jgi:hypothetical protein